MCGLCAGSSDKKYHSWWGLRVKAVLFKLKLVQDMHYWKQSQLAIVKESRGECFMSGHLRSTLGPCFCFYPNFDHWKTKDSSKFHICQNTVWGAPRQRKGDRGEETRSFIIHISVPASSAPCSLCLEQVLVCVVIRLNSVLWPAPSSDRAPASVLHWGENISTLCHSLYILHEWIE